MTKEATKAPEQAENKLRVFEDLTDIFINNTTKSLWLLIDNKVYDCTNFKHPGGR